MNLFKPLLTLPGLHAMDAYSISLIFVDLLATVTVPVHRFLAEAMTASVLKLDRSKQ